MRLQRHVSEWWFEPNLKAKRPRVPKRLLSVDPVNSKDDLRHTPPSRIGGFAHSRLWVRYNRLQAIDAGYITPLYDLRAIALRYGISEAGKRYFRKHILPEPFDIVRRRSVQAHHWSRFTLMVLDVVLGDLESRGFLQITKKHEDHIELLHRGVRFLEDHYAEQYNRKSMDMTDRHGVEWL